MALSEKRQMPVLHGQLCRLNQGNIIMPSISWTPQLVLLQEKWQDHENDRWRSQLDHTDDTQHQPYRKLCFLPQRRIRCRAVLYGMENNKWRHQLDFSAPSGSYTCSMTPASSSEQWISLWIYEFDLSYTDGGSTWTQPVSARQGCELPRLFNSQRIACAGFGDILRTVDGVSIGYQRTAEHLRSLISLASCLQRSYRGGSDGAIIKTVNAGSNGQPAQRYHEQPESCIKPQQQHFTPVVTAEPS
jgi:hypothetical protein